MGPGTSFSISGGGRIIFQQRLPPPVFRSFPVKIVLRKSNDGFYIPGKPVITVDRAVTWTFLTYFNNQTLNFITHEKEN